MLTAELTNGQNSEMQTWHGVTEGWWPVLSAGKDNVSSNPQGWDGF